MPLTLDGTNGVSAVQAGAVESGDLASGAIGSGDLPAGSVIQVVSATKTDTASTSTEITAGFTDITGLSVSITPTAISSKILVIASCAVGSNANPFVYIRLTRGATGIFVGNSAGVRPSVSGMAFPGGDSNGAIVSIPISFLDSPSTTSATTYKLQIANSLGGNTVFVNRSFRDTNDDAIDSRQASSITVMEIAG